MAMMTTPTQTQVKIIKEEVTRIEHAVIPAYGYLPFCMIKREEEKK